MADTGIRGKGILPMIIGWKPMPLSLPTISAMPSKGVSAIEGRFRRNRGRQRSPHAEPGALSVPRTK